jgi:hypothetical protein
MKGFIRKKKRISAQKNAFRQHFNPFIKTIVYVLLFIVIPTIFLGLCLKFFNFRKLFVQVILFFVFLLAKGYIFLSCLKLTNKWYLISDALFIAVFAGLYRFVEHCDRNFILLFFTVYVTCIHFFFMVRNIRQEGLTLLQEDVLSSKRIMNLVDVVKPIDVYIRNEAQITDNPQTAHDIDIELLAKRFFNSIDNKEFPVTNNEIVKIHHDLDINIFKQRRYNKSEFLNILISLDLIKSDSEYNNLKRRKHSPLKDYSLGGNLKKLLQVIAALKGIDCPSTCAKDIYDYWITTESSLN